MGESSERTSGMIGGERFVVTDDLGQWRVEKEG